MRGFIIDQWSTLRSKNLDAGQLLLRKDVVLPGTSLDSPSVMASSLHRRGIQNLLGGLGRLSTQVTMGTTDNWSFRRLIQAINILDKSS